MIRQIVGGLLKNNKQIIQQEIIILPIMEKHRL